MLGSGFSDQSDPVDAAGPQRGNDMADDFAADAPWNLPWRAE